MLEVSSLVNICGGPFKKKEAASVCGVLLFFRAGLSEINALKIRDTFGITFRAAENKSCRMFSLFLKLTDAVRFLRDWLSSTKMIYR